MTTNREVLESGRKRARTEEASCFRNSGSIPILGNKKNDGDLPKASASTILRANKISTKLSILLKEFPELKFILDFENLQAITEAAVVKYAEEKEAKKRKDLLQMNYGQETPPLYSVPDEVLSNCLSYVGKGHYGLVGLVSKKLNEIYKKEFGRETAYLEMATSVNLANHCLNDLCKSLGEKDEILKAAAVNGNLDILRAAVKDGYDLFPLVAMKKETKCYRNYDYDSDEGEYYGDSNYDEGAEIFDVYYPDDNKRKYYCRQTVNLAKLVERGHLHVLKYLHEEIGYILGLQRYWQSAIEYGKLEILQWLENLGLPDNVDFRIGFIDNYTLKTDFDYCECAIKSGNVEALKWLLEIGNYGINSDNSNVLVDAIRSKSKEMIQYCFDLGYNDLNSHNVEFAIKQTNSVEVFRKMNELGYEFGQMKRWHDSKKHGLFL
ncbi:hypothetical protein CTEN210_12039 [Chaetoceros tenuissimus]|uniref:F-box domain-containing protein n=1 Tax=Chaetoceros tenuissimus TaxID=426638 RepID=A0AAD3HA43_9STRA|nr:hypothetical protein CTEN210_12039 [Chaetoceros tenuissimus]